MRSFNCMKKVLTVFIVSIFAFSLSIPAIAQKVGKISRAENVAKTSIEYGNLQAYSDGKGVLLNWRMNAETNNVGFYVYRIREGETTLVSNSLVAGSYMKTGSQPVADNQYEYFDPSGDLRSVYYVQSVDVNGKVLNSQMFSPLQVTDLKSVNGNSAEFYSDTQKNSSAIIENKELKLPADLKAEQTANTSLADINMQRYVASQPGVKIFVKQEGFYRVTRSELQNGGFNVNSNSSTWKLFLKGVEQAINIGANDSYIEFYGKGEDVPESDKLVYYLISGGNAGKRIGTTVLRPLSNVLGTNYNQTFVKKDRSEYAGSLLNGDAENFFGTSVTNLSTTTINFNLDGIDENSPKCTIELNLQGLTTGAHNVTVTLNGAQFDPISGAGPFMMRGTYRTSTQFLRDGVNTLELKSTVGITLIESIKINYNRLYLAQNNQLSFYTNQYKKTTLNGFTSADTRVFDLTYPDEPTIITGLQPEQNGGTYKITLPGHRARVMYAVEDSAIKHPASIVQNFPSTLSTAAHNGEFVIIAHKDFMTVAENWANYRRGQGTSVEVVDIADVFDEFSYGSNRSLAIRSFLQYAKENWQTAPKYVLLIGDATYDPRNYKGFGGDNFVPSKLVDTIYLETGSDETLADFNDDGLAEIPIGRIAVRNPADATIVLNKVINFEGGIPQSFDLGFLFAFDVPNGYDFEGLSHRLADLLPPNVPKSFVGRAMNNSQALLVNDMNSGRYMINYSGHGNAKDWVNSTFFGYSVVPQLTNIDKPSIYTLLTCMNGYFVDPNPASESLSEFLVRYPNGGAVAAWSSTGLTTPDLQEVMATRFYTKLTDGTTPRFGDLIRDAKSVVVGGRDVRLSWSLLGDPMLKVR